MAEFHSSSDPLPQPPRGYGRGFKRNKPQRSGFAGFSGNRFPRSDWKELMHLQEVNQSSPWHHWTNAGCKVKNQRSTSLCWSFGSTGATEARHAQSMGWSPVLSAASVAGPINGYNPDRGGWAEYHFDFVKKHGQATVDTWPERSMNKALWNDPAVKSDRFQHFVPCFEEFAWKDLDALVSALLDPIDPTPCTVGFDYWGHLIWAGRATFTDNQITLWCINSWGSSWNGNGQIKLVGEDRCRAEEAIRVCGVMPRSKPLTGEIK